MKYLIIAIVLLLTVWFIGKLNKLKRQVVKVQEAESGIDIALTKRYDMLKKLFEIAKGYLDKEQQIIFESISLRSTMPMSEKNELNKQMDRAVKEINMVAEAYPNLSSIENFTKLQDGIMDAEEHLQAARRLYNSNVSALNQDIATFPTSIVASIGGIKNIPMFEADSHKREDVEFKF